MIRCRPTRIKQVSFADRRFRGRAQRSGAIYLEFLIVFPIVFLATLAIFQFGILSLVLQAATTAVTEGARTGAAYYPSGTTDAEIADEVVLRMNQFLAVRGLSIGSPGTAEILVERVGSPGVTRGALPLGFAMGPPSGPAPSSSEVRVTLSFPIAYIADPSSMGTPVPDLLNWLEFSMSSMKFEMSSRASLE